ncbi:MAG: thiol-disulfide oxidoreductase DCC family protein [Bacteroidota bacterium]|nr:thiol-disulfide oxidoreductase DCC family protein [Bacteroidota bacterium]
MPLSDTAEHPVILFDGVCNFCNASVNLILKNDKAAKYHFASLQSATGRQMLLKYGIPVNEIDSIVLIENEKVYLRSAAVFRIAKSLGGIVKAVSILSFLPSGLTDRVYSVLAKNRYKLFGKKQACMIPSPEWRRRFLDN